MTVLINLTFREMPTPATIAAVLASAKLDPTFEDLDLYATVMGESSTGHAQVIGDVQRVLADCEAGKITLSEARATIPSLHHDSPDDTERIS